MFWNVAGLGKKDENFWKGLKGWDVMVLVEMGGWEGMGEDEREVAEGIQMESAVSKKGGEEGET